METPRAEDSQHQKRLFPYVPVEEEEAGPHYATFKDVVGPTVTAEVIKRQTDAARRAAEWRYQDYDETTDPFRPR